VTKGRKKTGSEKGANRCLLALSRRQGRRPERRNKHPQRGHKKRVVKQLKSANPLISNGIQIINGAWPRA